MKKIFITLMIVFTMILSTYSQSGPGPVGPHPPSQTELTSASGSFGLPEAKYIPNYKMTYIIKTGLSQRVKLDITHNGNPEDYIEIWETNGGTSFFGAEKVETLRGPQNYQYVSYRSNGMLIVKIRTGSSIFGRPGVKPYIRFFYETTSMPVNSFPNANEVTINAHTTVPNLTVYEPIYKSIGSNLHTNTVIWDNSLLMLRSGNGKKLGVDAENICSSSALSLTAKSGGLKFNSAYGFDFSLYNKPSVFKIYKSGNIGINNPSNSDALINGKINGEKWESYVNLEDISGDYVFRLGNGGSNIGSSWCANITGRTIDKGSSLYLLGDHRGTTTSGRGILVLDGRLGNTKAPAEQSVIEFCSGWGNRLGHITGDGSLVMKGTIKAKAVKVTAQTADFVFEEDYNLRTLKDVEQFIRDNKHLPDIPSAAQMEEDGVNVAEMNKLLLQKIEELTLYTISQEEKLQKKAEEMQGLNSELDKMRNDLEKIKALLLTK
ncbi:hypothetical protein DMA11_23970 [Marinilabiliaceae bacterium JC017]|nr:hypothetical protein DMA11_23970 [Marinilabiliaceae bacterium JC017]